MIKRFSKYRTYLLKIGQRRDYFRLPEIDEQTKEINYEKQKLK